MGGFGGGVPERLGHQIYFLHLPLQGAPSPDPFQGPEASTPCISACGLEATPGPPATEECQPSPWDGSASPGQPPPTPGPPQVPTPAPAGGLCAGHLPGAEPQPPPVAAGWVGRPTGLSPHGPQQPPQLRLRWSGPCPCLAQPGRCTSTRAASGPPAPTQPPGPPTHLSYQSRAGPRGRSLPSPPPPGSVAGNLEQLWMRKPTHMYRPKQICRQSGLLKRVSEGQGLPKDVEQKPES